MTTILAESRHEKMTTLGCQRCDRVVRRSSKVCQMGVIESLCVPLQTFYLKMSEQNDYPEVVKTPKRYNCVVIVC